MDDPLVDERVRAAGVVEKKVAGRKWDPKGSPRDALRTLVACKRKGALHGTDLALASTTVAKTPAERRNSEVDTIRSVCAFVADELPLLRKASSRDIVAIHNSFCVLREPVAFLNPYLTTAKLAAFSTEEVSRLLASAVKAKRHDLALRILDMKRVPCDVHSSEIILHSCASLRCHLPSLSERSSGSDHALTFIERNGMEGADIPRVLHSCAALLVSRSHRVYQCAMERIARSWVNEGEEVRVLWALASAAVQAPGLFKTALKRGVARREHDALDWSHLLWAYSNAQHIEMELFGRVPMHSIEQASGQQLVVMARSYVKAGCKEAVEVIDRVKVKGMAGKECAELACLVMEVGVVPRCLDQMNLKKLSPRCVAKVATAAYKIRPNALMQRMARFLSDNKNDILPKLDKAQAIRLKADYRTVLA